MQSIHLIRDNLAKSRDRTLVKISEMKPHALIAPTPNGGGHTLWVLGHLAYIEGLVIRTFMLGETNPMEAWGQTFDGDSVGADGSAYPPFDDVLAKCIEMREATIHLLDGLNEEDLDRPALASPNGFEETFGTWRQCFQYVADHWYMHRGQLADSRRAAGLAKMWV
jgi:hypothetical protein